MDNRLDSVGGRIPAAPDMLGANHTGMRERNERLVLTLLRQRGPLSKSDIARATGLSAQTVSVIMRALEGEGLLIKCEPVRGKVGQPSVPMDLAPDGAFFLGLKIGRRRTEMVLLDFVGTVRGKRVTRHDHPTPDESIDFAVTAAADLVAQMPPDSAARIAGLGIGLPSRLRDWATALHLDDMAMADWQERDIRAELSTRMPWPVILTNDASAACNAELVFGRKEKPSSFLYACMSFFIGGGVVLDGILLTGHKGNAGALASMPVPAIEGATQPLHTAASLATLESRLGGNVPWLWESTEGWNIPPDVLDPWLEEAAAGIAFTAVSAAALCELEAVVIDGWLPRDLRRQLCTATAAAIGRLDTRGIAVPEVIEGTIGCDARAMGAASLVLSSRFLLEA